MEVKSVKSCVIIVALAMFALSKIHKSPAISDNYLIKAFQFQLANMT
jgi:hypothetical protein